MDQDLLKLATRELLSSFDSLEHASRHCRVKPANLSTYQNPDHSSFMPIDVVADLESAAGTTPVSRELATLGERTSIADETAEPLDCALDAAEVMAELQAFVRRAGTVMSPRQQREYAELRRRLAWALGRLDAAVAPATGTPAEAPVAEGGHLRVVSG